ncbi:STAS domain-containing protein [Streptomyces sp. Edi4]|uniref:STAS domain-containing protein n=1 Tax=Streptomyces sp. Edi4 TaxID=3162527 RepID=UPI003305E8FA
MNETMARVALTATGPDICRVSVAGDLDVVTAPEIRDALREAVATHQRVDLDCSGLTFVDCSGLGALLAAARTAKAAGSELRLCAVPRALARLLRLSHTDSAFAIEQTPVHVAKPPPGRSAAADTAANR